MKKIYILLIVLCLSQLGFSQQNPQFTHYMYNPRSINPAYMTNEPGVIEIGGIHRTQWTKLPGGPKTENLFVSVPLVSKLEFGANYTRDIIGSKIKIITDNFAVDGAYKVDLTDNISMSGGFKFGVNHIKLNAFESNIANDPIFKNTTKKTMFCIGTGVYFFNDNFYLGISTPNLLRTKFNKNEKGTVYQQELHNYILGGYIFNYFKNYKIKPSFALKQVAGSPISFDISANFLIYDKLEIGASNRNQESFSILAGFYINNNIRIGYSYDFGVNDLANYHQGSHEIIALYKFDILGLTRKYKSPRFY